MTSITERLARYFAPVDSQRIAGYYAEALDHDPTRMSRLAQQCYATGMEFGDNFVVMVGDALEKRVIDIASGKPPRRRIRLF